MTHATLVQYLVATMVAWNPPAHHREGSVKALARYQDIASDIADVTLDGAEQPVFDGNDGRVKTALLLTSIASMESGFRADVDAGQQRGGHGVAWCLMQVQVWGHTDEGWTGHDLVIDRNRCFTAGLHLVQASFQACKAMPVTERLSAYTIGHCRPDPKAEWRTIRALRWIKKHPFVGDAAGEG
jgi:hypothetical protein